jgi:hypothetical protein
MPLSTAPALSVDSPANATRIERATLVYRACLYYNLCLTAVWLLLIATGAGGGRLFANYRLTLQQIAGTVFFVMVFWVIWSYGWYFVKRWLLRRAGLDRDELARVFSSRLRGFDLDTVLARHSDRTLRIIDMVARRGRTLVFIAAGFGYVYVQTQKSPGPESLAFGLQANVFDSIVMNWLTLLAFRSNGVFGNIMYGAQARVLDGIQGRANALLIGTLWSAFRFVMIPLGLVLAGMYPPNLYAVLFAFIWITYAAADYATEVFGSLWGRHNIRVWGIGDLNAKSWEGFAAGFLCGLLVMVAIAWSQQLPISWYVLALVLAVINPIVELVSPRGTDDFTMATVNALVCVGFGWLVL